MPPSALPLPLPAALRGGRPSDARRRGRLFTLALALLLAALALAAYLSSPSAARPLAAAEAGRRCGGIQGLELWGPALNWGSSHRLPSAAACCAACRAHRRCDSWVFCGDRRRCGSRFGECWLKKQNDAMAPAVIARGEDVMWTSGLVFGKSSQGIVGLETSAGTLRVQLLPDCAPHSVDYFIELLRLHNCAGCRFYRAEGRGHLWDAKGDHVKNAAFGPPYALLQGTLEVDGVAFKEMPKEGCSTVRRGSVAWIGSGPEFLISLADHEEWRDAYTVFGSVVPEDMAIAEEMAMLPTSTDVWSGVTVRLLKDPVYIKVKRRSNATAY
ncbi:hypothetical protein CFC21_059762 [Triticum aestivum]|uniref:Peptidylprolyl isomerase n=2 Tax=Triticum aestivum TaxID=4565 RepID=A0A9R1GR26_WHEAT|nr:uncharacterized protein LOC123093981 [Triticum aestivum]KAF7051529.1 hypothetical protein CFC21_059762 [Triticum aestivum]